MRLCTTERHCLGLLNKTEYTAKIDLAPKQKGSPRRTKHARRVVRRRKKMSRCATLLQAPHGGGPVFDNANNIVSDGWHALIP